MVCCTFFLTSSYGAIYSILFFISLSTLLYYVPRFYNVLIIKFLLGMAHEVHDTPELLDARLDQRHRSYLSAVAGHDNLPVLRLRGPMELMRLDQRWFPKYAYFIFSLVL